MGINTTKQMIHTAAREYEVAYERIAPKLAPLLVEGGSADVVRDCLLVMAHTHVQFAMELMKQAGMTSQGVAGEFYFYADQQGPFDTTI